MPKRLLRGNYTPPKDPEVPEKKEEDEFAKRVVENLAGSTAMVRGRKKLVE